MAPAYVLLRTGRLVKSIIQNHLASSSNIFLEDTTLVPKKFHVRILRHLYLRLTHTTKYPNGNPFVHCPQSPRKRTSAEWNFLGMVEVLVPDILGLWEVLFPYHKQTLSYQTLGCPIFSLLSSLLSYRYAVPSSSCLSYFYCSHTKDLDSGAALRWNAVYQCFFYKIFI